jgi:hypothetical protein
MHIGDLLINQQAVERPERWEVSKRRRIIGIGTVVANAADPCLAWGK